MSLLWFEFTLAVRRLWRRPVQSWLTLATFTISLTLALLSWSLFYTVFQFNPAFDPHGRLYVVTYDGSQATSQAHSTYEELKAFKDGQAAFSDFAEMGFFLSVFVDTPQGMERFLGANVSSSAFRLLGAKPELGRLFLPTEDTLAGPRAAILSHRMWETRFGGDPAAIGKTVQVSTFPMTIVGVMPADFRFPNDQDLWLSMSGLSNSLFNPLRDGLARLKPGVTPERAERDLQVILNRLGPDSPANKHHLHPAVMPFREFYLGTQIRVSALILFSLSLLFVVVGCVNAANLMLIDFLGRQSEVAASLALGIPKRAAIRGLCFQVGVLSSIAMSLSLGILVLVAPVLHRGIMAMNPPYWLHFTIGAPHLLMAAALAAISACIALVAPISFVACLRPDRLIRENISASRGAGRGRSRRLLLTGQIAVLTVLGVCAGLLVRSSFHLSEGKWNYDARKVFLGSLSLQGTKDWRNLNDQLRFAAFHRVMEGVSRLPGISSAAYMVRPLGYSAAPNCIYALDPAGFSQNRSLGHAMTSAVTEQLFATIGVPFVAGSTFPLTTPPAGLTYAVINSSLAARLWPRMDPLNRALYVRYDGSDPTAPPARLVIVGVVRDFQASGPMASVNDCIYTPLQSLIGMSSTVYLLATGPVVPAVDEISRAVHSIDPGMSLYFTSTVGQQIDVVLNPVHLTTRLTILFAIAAVLLCGVGMYSITVSQVLQSSREFGIRMALGAEPNTLWSRFMRGHLLNALAGVLIGLVAAFQIAGLLRALLFGIGSHNSLTYLGVACAILAVTVLACVPSLFRLKRINPADCLRSL